MKTICLISGSSPEFLGGISLYQRNLIEYSKRNNLNFDFIWIYPGDKNRKYKLEGIQCIEVNSFEYPFLKEFNFARKARKIINRTYFDIISTHANWGYCLKGYKKKKNQKIIHTYHGVTYYFYKTHLNRFNLFKKLLILPSLLLSYFIEKPPIKKANKIICVSERVKREISELYGVKNNYTVLRTGVDLNKFSKHESFESRKKLGLEKNKLYGLYVGRGGYFRKGLDRAISISEKIYKKNKNYKLIVVGPDRKKVKRFIEKEFVIYIERGERDLLPLYYSACDVFYFLSRYEGGAPTLVTSEAMASECFIVFSEDSEQEIIEDKKDGLVVKEYGEKEANKILEILSNKKELNIIKKNASNKIKKYDLNSWAKSYFEVLKK